MAALTWRNVDAPDFRPSMEGYQTFGRLLDNAFGGLQTGLNHYDQTLDKRANNRILMQFAGIQDADAAKAALASLTSDRDAERLNAATIDSVSGRPNALIAQALNSENLGWTNYQHGRVRGFDAAEDTAAPLVADRLAAYGQGKGADWEAAHPGAFSGLSMAARTQMFTQGQQARMTDLDITGKGISNTGAQIGNRQAEFNLNTGEWRFGNEKLDRSRSEAVNNYLSRYASAGGNLDPNYLDADPAFRGLDGTSQMLVRSQLGGIGGGGGGTGAGGGGSGGIGGGAGGGDPSRIMNYQARAAGFASIPDNVTTLGGASDFALQVNRAGVPSSAMGLYQIVGDTMRGYAPKVFGQNWRNVDLSVQNQDRLAEAVFNDNRGSADALRKQWVSLSPQMAEQVRKMPWAQARQYIASGESGGNPAALMIGQTLAQQGGRNQFMQGNANSIAEPIQAALTDTSSLVDVASGLISEKGGLKGADRGWVMQQIQRIQAMGNGGKNPVQISPAAAAVILQRSTEARGGVAKFFDPSGSMSSGAISGDLTINNDTARSLVDGVRTGDYQRQVVTNQGISLRQQQVQTAEQTWTQARQRLQQAQQKAALNPQFDRSVLGRLSIAEQAAAQAYQSAINVAGTSAQAAGGMGRTAVSPPRPVSAPPRAQATAPAAPSAAAQPKPGFSVPVSRDPNPSFRNTDERNRYVAARVSEGRSLGIPRRSGMSDAEYASLVINATNSVADIQNPVFRDANARDLYLQGKIGQIRSAGIAPKPGETKREYALRGIQLLQIRNFGR